jgi:ribosome-associated toxin RatA of RatAB toxin-antitoxin module
MQTVRKSVIVARPASAMYALVDAYERYPEFLRWCSGAQVLDRTATASRSRLEIDYHGLKSHIATSNRMVPGERIDLEFVEGPFEHFQGHWHFVALGDTGCRVEFTLDYRFANRALERVLGPVFGHIVETLVDQFVARAESTPAPG